MADAAPNKTGASKFSADQALKIVITFINNALSSGIRDMVENKHVYQRFVLAYDQIVGKVRADTVSGYVADFDRKFKLVSDTLLMTTREMYAVNKTGQIEYQFNIVISNMKVYCRTCKRREPHKPIWFTDAANEIAKLNIREKVVNTESMGGFQLWLIALQCQGCLGTPQAVLIRRMGWTFTLDGRSPMEHIEVPSFIPKQEANWYRDALIATNSNKLLAATQYLRTTIEQFARRQTGLRGRATGDEIMVAYNGLLPEHLRGSMPSLREIYDKLSEAIHAAREDSAVVDEAKAAIEKHFDIRRAHGIEETVPTKAEPPEVN